MSEQPSREGRMRLLTESERSVIDAVIRCGDATSAAAFLCISPDTARTHLRNIRAKLGVNSTLEAVVLVMARARDER